MSRLVYGSKLTSLFKTISWRVIATLTTIALAWIFTDDISIALKIGGVELFAKMALYYYHERAWARALSS